MSKPFLPDDEMAALRGFARAHDDLVRLNREPVFICATRRSPSRRVGLVSGGGSGHEPLHIGFVGAGMLDAAAPGRVFASPHNRQVYKASRAVAGPGGVLHIVKNYTGDRINFGIAAERLAADGVAVRRVLVDDDIATESEQTRTGRRGTAATVLVEKVLGAAADDGLDIDELAELGSEVAAGCRSLGVASRAQTALTTGEPAFALAADEVEYGVGIHGERAATTMARPAFDELVARMCDALFDKVDGRELVVVVNGLGGTTQPELYAAFDAVVRRAALAGRSVVASIVGTLVPALDMRGFSITLGRLRAEWLPWLTAPAHTPTPLVVVRHA